MRRLVCSLFGALVLVSPLAAQPDSLEAQLDEVIQSDQLQAAGKRMQDASQAPADVVVLRSDQLRALGYRTLGDALGGVVGFRTNEDHAYQGMAVRGLYVLGDQNTRFLVLLDGHALNSPAEIGASKVGEDFGLPLELVDRIEIVRGPASSLYGNNAFQALINVVSLDAAQSRNTPFMAGMSFGDGKMAEMWANGGFRIGSVQAGIMVNGFQRRGWKRHYPQLDELYPQWSAGMPESVDREEKQSAHLRLDGTDWSFWTTVINRTQCLASGPFGSMPGDDGNHYRNTRLSGDFKWEPRSTKVKWMFRLFGDRNEFTDALMPDPLRNNYFQYDWCPDWSLGMELQARVHLHDRFSIIAGTEQRFHHYDGLTVVVEDGIFYRTQEDIVYRIGNTYLEGTWQVGEKWSLLGALQAAEWRPSRINIDVEGVSIPAAKEAIQRLTPRAALTWELGKQDVLKLGYGEGFRFPTLYERYYADDRTFFINERLKPEVISTSQLIWNHRWARSLKTQMSASLMRWKHQITVGDMPGGSQGELQYQNSNSLIRGKALEGELVYSRDRMECSLGLGWYDWRANGRSLDNVSKWNGYFRAIRHFGPFSLAGEARYVDARQMASKEFETAPETAPTRVNANWTLRASLRYEYAGCFVQLSLEDLLASKRRDLVAVDYEPITWMQGEGRQWRAMAGVRF